MDPSSSYIYNPIYEVSNSKNLKIEKATQTVIINNKPINVELVYSKGVSDKTVEKDLNRAIKRIQAIDFLFANTQIKTYSFSSDKKLSVFYGDTEITYSKKDLTQALEGHLRAALAKNDHEEAAKFTKALKTINNRLSWGKIKRSITQKLVKPALPSIEQEIQTTKALNENIDTKELSQLFRNRFGFVPLRKDKEGVIPLPTQKQLEGAFAYAREAMPELFNGADRSLLAQNIQEIMCGPMAAHLKAPHNELAFSTKELAQAKQEIPLKLVGKPHYLSWFFSCWKKDQNPISANLKLFFVDNISRPSNIELAGKSYNLQTDAEVFFKELNKAYFAYLDANPSQILHTAQKNEDLATSTGIDPRLSKDDFEILLLEHCQGNETVVNAIVEATCFTEDQLEVLTFFKGIARADAESLLRVMALRLMLVTNQRADILTNKDLDPTTQHPAEISQAALESVQQPVTVLDHSAKKAVIHGDFNGISFYGRVNLELIKPDTQYQQNIDGDSLHLPSQEVAWSKDDHGSFASYETEFHINAIVPLNPSTEPPAVLTNFKNVKVGPNGRNVLKRLTAAFKS